MKEQNERFGLLGEQLSHSYSPRIHEIFGSTPYLLYEIRQIELGDFLTNCRLQGMNVTIPYKKAVIRYCAGLSPKAQKIGAVNTLLRRENGWYGDNTDYDGFAYLLRRAGLWETIRQKKTLILGSGGASAAVRAVLADAGGQYTVISRQGAHTYETIETEADAAVLVNTTPVGMYPNDNAAPLDLRRLPQLCAVVDVIYNPTETLLMRQALSRGIPAYGGLPMLVAQAKAAAELFLGEPIAAEKIEEVLRILHPDGSVDIPSFP